MQTIDWRLFEAINGLAGHSGALDSLFKACAAGLEYVLLALVATLWLTRGENEAVDFARQRLVVVAVLAALLALGVNQIIGNAWYRPRPFVDHHVTQLVAHAADGSFPSDHAAGGMALAVSVILAADRWAKRLGWLLAALAALLAFARVFIGVHYPGDVVGGCLIGAASAWLLHALIRPLGSLLLPLLRPLHQLTEWIANRLRIGRWPIFAAQAPLPAPPPQAPQS
ncbi:MAG: phosphatase PAP2 family protein [Dehalococcoidia bacterium]